MLISYCWTVNIHNIICQHLTAELSTYTISYVNVLLLNSEHTQYHMSTSYCGTVNIHNITCQYLTAEHTSIIPIQYLHAEIQ
jgi:hypothetical protein